MIRSILVCCLAAFLLSGGVAYATPISITNASFENPIDTGAQPRAVTGWTQVGGASNSGVWNINAFPFGFWSVGAPDGSQIAFLSAAPQPGTPASIYQVLGDSVLANEMYTLSGYVGSPRGFGGVTGNGLTQYTVALYDNSTNTLLNSMSGTGPEGSFAPFSLTFNSFAAGGALEVRLSSNQAQTGFDAIALDASPIPGGGAAVPEPASLLLFGTGLAAAGARRWRKSR